MTADTILRDEPCTVNLPGHSAPLCIITCKIVIINSIEKQGKYLHTGKNHHEEYA